jgi:hypothetical protein
MDTVGINETIKHEAKMITIVWLQDVRPEKSRSHWCVAGIDQTFLVSSRLRQRCLPKRVFALL